jgi:ubiquinone/menaquinone biosynthesis C-methylase UbiE
MSSLPEGYIPAAGRDSLLPIYDPFFRLVMREPTLRREILEHARIGAQSRVLDVGCGTGTQAVLTKRAHPDAEVIGVDGDPKALAIAKQKAARAGVEVGLDEGLATALPYADRRFDRVLSSLVFHHLEEADKRRAASEILRVLAPGGFFLLVDFGAPRTFFERAIGHVLRHGGHARLQLEGGMPALLRDAGFSRVEDVAQLGVGFARVWYWRATA